MLPRGIRNNNPGNLVITTIPWKGKIPKDSNTDGKFEQFDTMINGIRAMMKDVIHDIRGGKNTIEKLFAEYAPKEENDLEAYIKAVCKETGLVRHEILTISKDIICFIAKAISKHENGGYFISNEQLESAWNDI